PAHPTIKNQTNTIPNALLASHPISFKSPRPLRIASSHHPVSPPTARPDPGSLPTTGNPGPFHGTDPVCEPPSRMEKRGEALVRGSPERMPKICDCLSDTVFQRRPNQRLHVRFGERPRRPVTRLVHPGQDHVMEHDLRTLDSDNLAHDHEGLEMRQIPGKE